MEWYKIRPYSKIEQGHGVIWGKTIEWYMICLQGNMRQDHKVIWDKTMG